MATRSPFAQLPDEQRQRLFEQRQLVGVLHRAGNVDEKDQVDDGSFLAKSRAFRPIRVNWQP